MKFRVTLCADRRLRSGLFLLQIPGKLLFSLVKRYLCVTSLMDKLNTAGTESVSEKQDASPSHASCSSSSTAHQNENLRIQREFDFTMAMANLISELVRVMGWDRNRQPPDSSAQQSAGGGAFGKEPYDDAFRPVLRSIFQPRFCASPVGLAATSAVASPTATQPKKKNGNSYKTRSDFACRSAYVEYVQDNLKSGMVVRMLEDYEEVSAGDEGEFRYSNDGSPPVQVSKTQLLSPDTQARSTRTSPCVPSRCTGTHCPGPTGFTGTWCRSWEAAAAARQRRRSRRSPPPLRRPLNSPQVTVFLPAHCSSTSPHVYCPSCCLSVSQMFFSKPPGGLYSLPYLSEGLQTEQAVLSRAEWWEILFFIKKLEPKQQQEVNSILLENLDDLVKMPERARKHGFLLNWDSLLSVP